MMIRRYLTELTSLAFVSCLLAPSQAAGAESIRIDGLVVVLIDEADVPAAKDGVIAELKVAEGKSVDSGQTLARLDDRRARVQLSAAKIELETAEHRRNSRHLLDLAEKKLAQQKQLQQQHEIELEIAAAKASNEVKVLASEKAEAVAKNEVERAQESRRTFIDSVSESEVEKLQLAHERTTLETRQAQFERRLDALQLRAEQEAANTVALSVEVSAIERDAAISDLRLSELDVELKRQQFDLANLAVKEHEIRAPWKGVIVKRYRNLGEWIKQGEPIVRLIRLDRLRAEGFATPDMVPHLRKKSSVELTVRVGNGQTVQCKGEIVFVSPELDPINQERPFWIEFDNPDHDILPGMPISVTITP